MIVYNRFGDRIMIRVTTEVTNAKPDDDINKVIMVALAKMAIDVRDGKVIILNGDEIGL